MLKKLKCIEATATLASSAVQAVSNGSNNANSTTASNSGSNLLGANVKIIKTEPIDFEMLHLEEKDLRERRLTRDAETITTTVVAAPTTSTQATTSQQQQQPRYQHVQVQTVPPRQPGGLTLSSSTQKVILTPRVEYVQRAGGNTTTTIKHIYTQHVAVNGGEQNQQQQQPSAHAGRSSRVSTNNLHESGNALLSASASGGGNSPQIIITRTLPAGNGSTQPHLLQRRHSASPSAIHYQRMSVGATSSTSSAPLSPPPLHQRHHSPPPPMQQQQQQQQHVRVIRDGRLYEETLAAAATLTRRHSVSPPPLHHHSRSAPVSPAAARRYSMSPQREQQLANAEMTHMGNVQYQQRQTLHSPTLPPPPPPPPLPQTSVTLTTTPQQQYSASPTRKYIVNSGSRQVNVISTNVGQQQQHFTTTQQQQHQQHHHHNQQHHQHQHQHHHHHQQHHQQQQATATTSSPASTTTPSAASTHVFRTPVVSSSSSNSQRHHSNNNSSSSSSSTSMRPPPPPPPPKIKNHHSPPMSVGLGGHATGSGSSGGMSGANCEEPSSSIPDLEFDGTTVLCRVCGDKASGFHYGVHSCEGCKGFFRRSIQQKIQYRPCTKNQQCSILRINRNRCQYCRLKKCIAVGMSRDAVRFGRVPKREKARILAAMQQSTQNRGQQRALATELDDQPRLLAAVLRAHLDTCEFTKEKVAAMRQRARECPSYSMPTLLACPLNPAPELQSEQEFSQRFAHVIRGVIDFAGMIPGFQLLTQDDKFTLLKAGLFDALFVRLICMFDSSINSIICLNGQVMRRDAIQNGANARFLVDSTFNFAERMNSMNLTDAEIGLFCAIVLITPDRPGLRNIELIEKMYSRLKGCLQSIINQNRPDQPEFMVKLLDTMPDLRTLSTLHTEKLVVFRTEHKELLRQQMWTMDDAEPPTSKSPGSSWDEARMDVVEAKSPLGSVSSTESGDLEYTTSSTTPSAAHHQHPHLPLAHHHHSHAMHGAHAPSSLASSAPLLAATLSGSCPLRNRANSGSSGDSAAADLDIVGSHAHLTQNGLTITPIVRAHSHQQLHHHLTAGAGPAARYRKLDSPTDSGIESGNEKNECKAVSSGGSSSCSSPRSSVDDALDCSDAATAAAAVATSSVQVTVSVSPVRSPQPQCVAAPSSTSSASSSAPSTLKRQIVEDMPVLKRVLQAPPLYDTNSLMDEAYKPHKKFRALRHREYESAEADASSSTNSNGAAPSTTANLPACSPVQSSQNLAVSAGCNSPAPTSGLVVPQASISPAAVGATSPNPAAPLATAAHQQLPYHQSQLHMHLTRNTPTTNVNNSNSNSNNNNSQQQASSLSSTHSVLAKSLMAEPRMTPEQIKRSDIIQNYIMREPPVATSSSTSCTPNGPGSRSPAPPHLAAALQHNSVAAHHYATNGSPASSSSPNSNCASPSTTTVTLASPPPPAIGNGGRWPGHSVITTTSHNQRQQSVSPHSNGSNSSTSSSLSSSSASSSGSGCQYFQSPHSTSASVSPPRPSPSAIHSPPRLLELQVDIADSQQPLNLSKKSPTPPPSKLQALVAAATAAQRYPTVSADVTVTATTAPAVAATAPPATSSTPQVQVHKVMLEA